MFLEVSKVNHNYTHPYQSNLIAIIRGGKKDFAVLEYKDNLLGPSPNM